MVHNFRAPALVFLNRKISMSSQHRTRQEIMMLLVVTGLLGCSRTTVRIQVIDGESRAPLSNVRAILNSSMSDLLFGSHSWTRSLAPSGQDGIVIADSLDTRLANEINLRVSGYSYARVRFQIHATTAAIDTPIDLNHSDQHAPSPLGIHGSMEDVRNGQISVQMFKRK